MIGFLLPPWLSVPLKLLKRVPPKAWLWLGVAILASALVLTARSHWIHVGEARTQVTFDAYRAKVIAATQKAKDAAIRAERAQAGAIAAVADHLTQENAHALARRDATIADLRSGALRVRVGAIHCPRVPEAATSAGVGDAASAGELSDATARSVLDLGAEADQTAQRLTACQAILKAERN